MARTKEAPTKDPLKRRIVHVAWRDAASLSGWAELQEWDSPPVCYTVGYLMRTDRHAIFVLSTHDYNSTNKHTNAGMVIPKGCVEECRRLWGGKANGPSS